MLFSLLSCNAIYHLFSSCERRLVSDGTRSIFLFTFFRLLYFFFFKTADFEFNDHRLCIGTRLIRSSSVQFVYIGFQFFFGYSNLFQFFNDGFFQFLHPFIFFLFSHRPHSMVFESMPLSHLLFSQRFTNYF